MDIYPNPENGQAVVKYTSFQDLIDDISNLDDNFLIEINKIKDVSDWKQSFDYLDMLRKYNKFHADEFLVIFPKLMWFLISNINNLRSNLTKNALTLLKEIFTYNIKFLTTIALQQPEALSDLIPLIYEKGNNDKAFLKNEAKEAIKSFEKNSPLNENLFKILLALTQEKNAGISEKASESLCNIILSKEEEILTKENGKELYALLLIILAKLLDSNRMVIKKHGDELLGLLLKCPDFERYLEDCLDKKEKDAVVLAVENRKKAGSGKSKESLKDFLSKKKQG